MAALSFLRAPAPEQVKTLLGWWKHLRQERDSGSLPSQPADGGEASSEGGATEVRSRPVMERQPGEDSFLVFCERLFALSLEQAALLTRATETTDKGDQDAVEAIAEQIEANTVERRIVLWRLQEMANLGKQ